MSYFENQFDEWMENNCEGDVEDYGDGTTYALDEEDEDEEDDL